MNRQVLASIILITIVTITMIVVMSPDYEWSSIRIIRRVNFWHAFAGMFF